MFPGQPPGIHDHVDGRALADPLQYRLVAGLDAQRHVSRAGPAHQGEQFLVDEPHVGLIAPLDSVMDAPGDHGLQDGLRAIEVDREDLVAEVNGGRLPG